MLRKINNVNRQATTKKVGHEQFYIPELTDKVDVKRDYFKWLVDAPNKVSRRFFAMFQICLNLIFLFFFIRNFVYATIHLSLMPKPKPYFWKPIKIYRCIRQCKKQRQEAYFSASLLFSSILFWKFDGITW